MKSNKEIIEKIEFSEGNDLYLSEKRLIHEALQIQKEDILNEIEKLKETLMVDMGNIPTDISPRGVKTQTYHIIPLRFQELKQKLEEKDGKTNT